MRDVNTFHGVCGLIYWNKNAFPSARSSLPPDVLQHPSAALMHTRFYKLTSADSAPDIARGLAHHFFQVETPRI
jgi:hypothetical protein